MRIYHWTQLHATVLGRDSLELTLLIPLASHPKFLVRELFLLQHLLKIPIKHKSSKGKSLLHKSAAKTLLQGIHVPLESKSHFPSLEFSSHHPNIFKSVSYYSDSQGITTRFVSTLSVFPYLPELLLHISLYIKNFCGRSRFVLILFAVQQHMSRKLITSLSSSGPSDWRLLCG